MEFVFWVSIPQNGSYLIRQQFLQGTLYIINSGDCTDNLYWFWNIVPFTVADPGFPWGGGANPPGGANIQFCQIFPKTAWNWKNLDPGWSVTAFVVQVQSKYVDNLINRELFTCDALLKLNIGLQRHSCQGSDPVADPRGRGAPGTCPPMNQNFLNFMQFFGKSGKFVCWCPPPGGLAPPPTGILDPPCWDPLKKLKLKG